ncbi:MAG: hypothetical protein BV456_03085 [Thermoplasmata archaeon M8B2D]|nr:MAG: hypothetical protein BV456_03085 [Thermoplasmata archaeon M8B2D]
MSLYNSVLEKLNGTIDGVNKSFETPTKFVSGTIKIVVNGQIYEPDDENFGWIETSDSSIDLETAPIDGDILQAFYQDLDTEHLGLNNVIGTPFDPDGILP